jgi:hypothetical protein
VHAQSTRLSAKFPLKYANKLSRNGARRRPAKLPQVACPGPQLLLDSSIAMLFFGEAVSGVRL